MRAAVKQVENLIFSDKSIIQCEAHKLNRPQADFDNNYSLFIRAEPDFIIHCARRALCSFPRVMCRILFSDIVILCIIKALWPGTAASP